MHRAPSSGDRSSAIPSAAPQRARPLAPRRAGASAGRPRGRQLGGRRAWCARRCTATAGAARSHADGRRSRCPTPGRSVDRRVSRRCVISSWPHAVRRRPGDNVPVAHAGRRSSPTPDAAAASAASRGYRQAPRGAPDLLSFMAALAPEVVTNGGGRYATASLVQPGTGAAGPTASRRNDEGPAMRRALEESGRRSGERPYIIPPMSGMPPPPAAVLLGHLGDDRLGGEDVLGDRGRVLQRRARDHRRVDDAGLRQVDDTRRSRR